MADATAAAFLFGNAAAMFAERDPQQFNPALPDKRPRLSLGKRVRLSTDRAPTFFEERIMPSPLAERALWGRWGYAMIEFLFIYQLARNPVQAFARSWLCRSLYRATRGRRRCPECRDS